MKVDGGIGTNLANAGAQAKELEAAGYSGGWTAETSHDPFLPLLLAAEHTEHLEIGTSIAVAFARNPMLLANIGWDLQSFSKGRFVLGLGSQIKPHITKRFSMEWSHPAPRMREMSSGNEQRQRGGAVGRSAGESGVELDRRKVTLEDPIREVGTHRVNVKLHADVEFPVTVEVSAG